MGDPNIKSFPQVLHICVGELGNHWCRYWFVTYSALSHYLNQCWDILLGGSLGTNFSGILIKIRNLHLHKCV